MMAKVFRVKDREKAREVLEMDDVKRAGYIERDGRTLGVGDGMYVYIRADEEVLKLFEDSGAFEVPENEEEVRRKIEDEQDSAVGGVGFLGI